MVDVENAEKLMGRFGGWPSFYEATLLDLVISGEPGKDCSAEIEARVPANEGRRDRGGPSVLEHPTHVVLRFEGIGWRHDLEGVECPDTLFEVQISAFRPEDDDGCSIEVVLTMTRDGHDGFFCCKHALVVEVEPLGGGEPTQ